MRLGLIKLIIGCLFCFFYSAKAQQYPTIIIGGKLGAAQGDPTSSDHLRPNVSLGISSELAFSRFIGLRLNSDFFVVDHGDERMLNTMLRVIPNSSIYLDPPTQLAFGTLSIDMPLTFPFDNGYGLSILPEIGIYTTGMGRFINGGLYNFSERPSLQANGWRYTGDVIKRSNVFWSLGIELSRIGGNQIVYSGLRCRFIRDMGYVYTVDKLPLVTPVSEPEPERLVENLNIAILELYIRFGFMTR